jgi:hypothetical protein
LANWLDKYEPDEYYLSEEGFIVFTEKHHLKRGYCCQNGCRHCPYGFKNKNQKKKNLE